MEVGGWRLEVGGWRFEINKRCGRHPFSLRVPGHSVPFLHTCAADPRWIRIRCFLCPAGCGQSMDAGPKEVWRGRGTKVEQTDKGNIHPSAHTRNPHIPAHTYLVQVPVLGGSPVDDTVGLTLLAHTLEDLKVSCRRDEHDWRCGKAVRYWRNTTPLFVFTYSLHKSHTKHPLASSALSRAGWSQHAPSRMYRRTSMLTWLPLLPQTEPEP